MNITGQCLQVIKRFLGTEIPCAQDVLNFTRYEQLLELGRNIVAPVRNVQITKNQNKLKKITQNGCSNARISYDNVVSLYHGHSLS